MLWFYLVFHIGLYRLLNVLLNVLYIGFTMEFQTLEDSKSARGKGLLAKGRSIHYLDGVFSCRLIGPKRRYLCYDDALATRQHRRGV